MILISHRGNINGKNINLENSKEYVQQALNLGFDVEVDLWVINNKLFLGHDKPQYKINAEWLINRKQKLWIHNKNIESLQFIQQNIPDINYFWHQKDDYTLTNNNYIWTFPGKKISENSIAVLPELNNDNISKCVGICSDYIKKYKK